MSDDARKSKNRTAEAALLKTMLKARKSREARSSCSSVSGSDSELWSCLVRAVFFDRVTLVDVFFAGQLSDINALVK